MPPEVIIPAVAEECFDAPNGRTRTFADTDQGREAVRWFRVRHDDPVIVAAAANLPRRGDAWPDAAWNHLVCVAISTAMVRGRVTWLQALYRERSRAPSDLTAVDGDAFHDLAQNQASVEIVRDIQNNEIPPTQIEAGAQELTVTAYRSNISFRAIWLGLIGKLNANAVEIPPVRGFPATSFIAPAKTLLARPLTYEVVRAGLIKVVYRMGEAPDWTLRVQPRDDMGHPVGNPTEHEVYEAVQWPATALWGGPF